MRGSVVESLNVLQVGTGARSRVVARRVFTARDWAWFAAVGAAQVGALAWFATALVRSGSAQRLLPLLALSSFALLSFEARWWTLPLMRRPQPMPVPDGLRVAVVTTFVPGAESPAMLRRTLAAMVELAVAHDTWVLDEGDDPEIRRNSVALGARHFSRRGRSEYRQPEGRFAAGTKHGNLNAWLDAVGFEHYDVVVAFDPDHVPAPHFLERTLGYLADDEIGYVQAAQVYYNQPAGLVARGAAEETYGYYSSVQMASYGLGYPIVTGCHNVNRTAALREIGGFAAHDADDLLTTVHYRAHGWRGVYVPEALAAGLTPVDWPAYLNQQRRWARSVLDVKLRRFPELADRLPLVERVVAWLHGLYYLHGVATAVGVAGLAVALAQGWRSAPWPDALTLPALAAIGALAGAEAFRQRFHLHPRAERGLHLRAGLLKFAKWPWVLAAFVDALAGRRIAFTITPKVRSSSPRLVLLRGHGLPLRAVLAGALVGGLAGRPPSGLVAMAAVAYVTVTGGLLLSEVRAAPPPYDDALAAQYFHAPTSGNVNFPQTP
jgi:cellulose synthase (UDP-forming)